MKIIEIDRVEDRNVFVVNGEIDPGVMNVTVDLSRCTPTTVFVNGVRTTEPTRVVRQGRVVGIDMREGGEES